MNVNGSLRGILRMASGLGAATMLLMGAALFGIQQLNQALAVYETSVAQSYAQGLRSLSGSKPRTTGWRQGRGMDREPSKLLDEAAELIAKASADTASQAAQRRSSHSPTPAMT